MQASESVLGTLDSAPLTRHPLTSDIVAALKAELAQEVQLRETALSSVIEAISLETNARIAKGAELRRELHAMVREYGERTKPGERGLQDSKDAWLKEAAKLWHALDMHTHSISVDLPGNLSARETVRTGQLTLMQMSRAVQPGPSRHNKMEAASKAISPAVSSHSIAGQLIPAIVNSPSVGLRVQKAPADNTRVLQVSASEPHLHRGRTGCSACNNTSGVVTPRSPRVSPRVSPRPQRSIPATVQSGLADADIEGLLPPITATCGAAHYVLEASYPRLQLG